MCCAIADPPPFNPTPSPHHPAQPPLRRQINSRQQWTCNSRNEKFYSITYCHLWQPGLLQLFSPNMYGFFLSRNDVTLRHVKFQNRSTHTEWSCIVSPRYFQIRNMIYILKTKDVQQQNNSDSVVEAENKNNSESKLHHYRDVVVWLLSIIITVTAPCPCSLIYLSSLCAYCIIYLLSLIILFVSFCFVTWVNK